MRTIQSVRVRSGQAQCWSCLEFWPLTEEYFYRDSRNSDGFRHQCKGCVAEEQAKRKDA